jgi:hypothetical protein
MVAFLLLRKSVKTILLYGVLNTIYVLKLNILSHNNEINEMAVNIFEFISLIPSFLNSVFRLQQ